MFTLTFTQIQLIEAMIWKNINDELNNKLVKYISVLLWVRHLIQSSFSYLYSKNSFISYLFFIYLVIILKELKSTDIFTLTISNKGHLVWDRYENNKKIHILGYLTILLFVTLNNP
jgi:type IV secretory pathway TraG/TraD family ATPase VirD4